MNEIYFVIGDSPFTFDGQSTLVVKVSKEFISDVVTAARRDSVQNIYIARATEVFSRTVSYKSKKLGR